MHFIKHNSLGFHTGRWYKIEDRRWVQFNIAMDADYYRLIILKGYGHPTNSEKPRATTQIVNEIRDNLKAVEKLFDRYIKETEHRFPALRTNLQFEAHIMTLKQLGGM